MFPIVQHNENPDLSVFGFDYSKSAVDVVKVCSCAFTPPTPASTDCPFRFPTRNSPTLSTVHRPWARSTPTSGTSRPLRSPS